ncbi:MAG: triose-phosphate isomerase [Candidatus Omnitrophica bacterium]|nr:triose-phosphate isomerase [Candidatus Omnitrophota bacterium]
MMRKIFIAGNWKMVNGAPAEAVELAKGVVAACGAQDKVEVAVCPPATALAATCEATEGSLVQVGGQNLYPAEKGAYTGEISPNFLTAVGCSHVILGHSERRTIFKESDSFINEKVKVALAHGLTPILCCGETEQEREDGVTEKVVEKHIRGGLEGLSSEEIAKVVIAYEPVWAIGTGKTATPEDAQAVHAFIRGLLKELAGDSVAEGIRIQYGGSVKPDNAKELLSQTDIDGALVGGASLQAESFAAIVEAGM